MQLYLKEAVVHCFSGCYLHFLDPLPHAVHWKYIYSDQHA